MITPLQLLEKNETFTQTFLRKLKSHRVIWCWIYLSLYVWMAIYAILKYPASVNTVIVTTGSMCATIISIYICGSSYENTKYNEQLTKLQVNSGSVGPGTDER